MRRTERSELDRSVEVLRTRKDGAGGMEDARHGNQDAEVGQALEGPHPGPLEGRGADHGRLGMQLLQVLDDGEGLAEESFIGR